MTREEIENCWKDPRNWKWGVYYCKADPRVIVPKHRNWMGWTANFAHPSAIPIILLLSAVVVAPVWVVSSMGAGAGLVLGTGIIAIGVLCSLCAYLSARTK